MGDYFTKNYPPRHHREIFGTYFYMENALLKINHKIMHEWANAVLTPIHKFAITQIHTVAITQKRTVMQGCANFVRKYGHINTKTVM